MTTKFNICDKVFFFNTAECRVEKVEIKGIRIIATGISKNESGESVLDGSIVLYETVNGPVLAESECFADEQSLRKHYLGVFSIAKE